MSLPVFLLNRHVLIILGNKLQLCPFLRLFQLCLHSACILRCLHSKMGKPKQARGVDVASIVSIRKIPC